MPLRGRHGWLGLAAIAAITLGCSAPPAPPYPRWAPEVAAHAPSPDSGNAFDGYVLASREAESAAGELAGYVSFENKHKTELIERLAPAMRRLRRAALKQCDFRIQPVSPADPPSYHSGWRLLKNSMTWQIESAVKRSNYDAAVDLAILESKVGFDIAGGTAADADLGLQMADEARRAIASSLPDLTPGQLSRLTTGMKAAYASMPNFATIAKNESASYLTQVQWVQDHYRAGKLNEIDEYLGPQVRDATTFLAQLKKEDREKRPSYFQGFADEANRFADWAASQGSVPYAKRKKDTELELADYRPWKKYSAALFTTLRPVQARYDATVARTRLLILSSELMRLVKVARAAPKTLDAFSAALVEDPFSGSRFKYRATGMEFFLYSVGANLQDDQGVTDSIFAAPDLTLESSRR
jgi:hypothetical protein